MIRLLIILIMLFYTLLGFSQERKEEKESRINREQMPSGVISEMDSYLSTSKKIRFYSETDGNKKSFEIKLTRGEMRYSIEFDEQGVLEDIEVIISISELDQSLQQTISRELNSLGKYRIFKVQKQFSTSSTSTREALKLALEERIGEITRYEIEVSIKEDGKWKPYEFLLSDTGEVLSKRRIVKRSSEYLLY